jgi:hypothetical protein
MTTTTHTARITGPVSYLASNGRMVNIPLGPCMVERCDGTHAEIVWGAQGRRSVALPFTALQAAREQGHLVLLD